MATDDDDGDDDDDDGDGDDDDDDAGDDDDDGDGDDDADTPSREHIHLMRPHRSVHYGTGGLKASGGRSLGAANGKLRRERSACSREVCSAACLFTCRLNA